MNLMLLLLLKQEKLLTGEKNDFGDAKVISIFAKHTKLQEVSVKTIELKKKITTRKLLVNQRTQLINNIKSLCVKSGIKLPFKSLTSIKAAKWLTNNEDISIATMGKVISEINQSIKILEEEIKNNLPKEVERLTQQTGMGERVQ